MKNHSKKLLFTENERHEDFYFTCEAFREDFSNAVRFAVSSAIISIFSFS